MKIRTKQKSGQKSVFNEGRGAPLHYRLSPLGISPAAIGVTMRSTARAPVGTDVLCTWPSMPSHIGDRTGNVWGDLSLCPRVDTFQTIEQDDNHHVCMCQAVGKGEKRGA